MASIGQVPEALAAALDLYGLNKDALAAQPQGWYVGDVPFMTTFASGVAYSGSAGSAQVLDTMERLDPRIGAFGSDGAWVLALAVRHLVVSTPAAFGAAGADFPLFTRMLAALGVRWTPAAGQPAFTALVESFQSVSLANRRENADMAEAVQAAAYNPAGPKRLDYPWLIDTVADAHSLVYGGGPDAPPTTPNGLSVITIYTGAVIGKSVIPARPVMPCRAVPDKGGPKAASRIGAA